MPSVSVPPRAGMVTRNLLLIDFRMSIVLTKSPMKSAKKTTHSILEKDAKTLFILFPKRVLPLFGL